MTPTNLPLSPMLLPWLAKKAGIPAHRAETLWHEACRYAAARAEPETSDYFRIAIDRLTGLIAAESLRADAASFGWRPWARAQNRLWKSMLHAADAASVAGGRALRAVSVPAWSLSQPAP